MVQDVQVGRLKLFGDENGSVYSSLFFFAQRVVVAGMVTTAMRHVAVSLEHAMQTPLVQMTVVLASLDFGRRSVTQSSISAVRNEISLWTILQQKTCLILYRKQQPMQYNSRLHAKCEQWPGDLHLQKRLSTG